MRTNRILPRALKVGVLALGFALMLGIDTAAACARDNGGLTLPEGLCATIFADNLGPTRHLAVTDDGTVYVNTWRSPYKKDAKIPAGGFLVALRDGNGDGVAETALRFGEDSASSAVGGTGIAVHNDFLYAETSGRILRYPLIKGEPVPQRQPEVILAGLPLDDGHTMHPFAVGRDGALFVNSGSATNACQVRDRALHSPGKDPCDELLTRAGLWKYDANRPNQRFGPGARYASGLRNTVALAIHPAAGLYAIPHGRDQLYQNWPERFDEKQGSELPAELMVRVQAGADYGWPYCYYDGFKRKYMLAPEYGGNGLRADRCGGKPEPLAAYPAHWAPDALLVYTGTYLPERYQGGAFIAFHGSWNRQQQQGYNVVFQPLDRAGTPSGDYEVFADGFAGANKTPEAAAQRPAGVAMGPDGALYVSDDQGGRIWRITRR